MALHSYVSFVNQDPPPLLKNISFNNIGCEALHGQNLEMNYMQALYPFGSFHDSYSQRLPSLYHIKLDTVDVVSHLDITYRFRLCFALRGRYELCLVVCVD
jgi:hypothetical protein